MNLSQQLSIVIEVENNNKRYSFSLPFGDAYKDVVEAFNEIGKKIMEMGQEAEKQQKAQQEQQEQQPQEQEAAPLAVMD